MAKGFFQDTRDQFLEFGVSTAKGTIKGVVKAFNPLQPLLEKKGDVTGSGKDPGMEKMAAAHEGKSTPLDLQKLQGKYENQDKMQIEAMRSRLFNMVKSEGEMAIQQRKQQEEERKRKELFEMEEKKKKEQERYQQQSMADVPQGKVRQTIGATHKKKTQDSHTEFKANAGKP